MRFKPGFCRICDHPISPFMDFGDMPIGNGFLSLDGFETEYFYKMKVAVCDRCCTFQVVEVPDPKQMFHSNYAYFASTSHYMVKHFREMSEKLIDDLKLDENSLVVEIGCNDGITLKNFVEAGVPSIGIEPSSNVAEKARSKGIKVLDKFFNLETSTTLVEEVGNADLFIATNTMHHIEDINSVFAGVKELLKPKGVMVQEDPYLGDMLKLVSYDQIYAEHMYLWSITSLNNVLARHGLEIFDIERNKFHGGCMRYYICHKGAFCPTEQFLKQQNKEVKLGIKDEKTYHKFRLMCEESRDRLVNKVSEIRKSGKKIVGYGATAKSATIINYCNLTCEDIPCIFDSTDFKQGKYSPGAHIPVLPAEQFKDEKPDFAILFAWNHFKEINDKEKDFERYGGEWVIPIGQLPK